MLSLEESFMYDLMKYAIFFFFYKFVSETYSHAHIYWHPL